MVLCLDSFGLSHALAQTCFVFEVSLDLPGRLDGSKMVISVAVSIEREREREREKNKS
jgi:hypothetical protein